MYNLLELTQEEIKAMLKEKQQEIKKMKNEVSILRDDIKAKQKQVERLKTFLEK